MKLVRNSLVSLLIFSMGMFAGHKLTRSLYPTIDDVSLTNEDVTRILSNYDISIESIPREKELLGYVDKSNKRIIIDSDLGEFAQKETLIHEMLHIKYPTLSELQVETLTRPHYIELKDTIEDYLHSEQNSSPSDKGLPQSQ